MNMRSLPLLEFPQMSMADLITDAEIAVKGNLWRSDMFFVWLASPLRDLVTTLHFDFENAQIVYFHMPLP